MNAKTSHRAMLIALTEANPRLTGSELARILGWSSNRFYHACHRHGIKLRNAQKRRATIDTFVGDLFLDAHDFRRPMVHPSIPQVTMHGYRNGASYPSFTRIKLLEEISGSRVTTTGRLRAAVNRIRNSTSDLEMLQACGIMSDIIQEIEDAI